MEKKAKKNKKKNFPDKVIPGLRKIQYFQNYIEFRNGSYIVIKIDQELNTLSPALMFPKKSKDSHKLWV